MKSSVDTGKEVIRIEAEALSALIDKVDERFDNAVELLHNCAGRVVVSGVGKSGVIGMKISSTLCSTGTPAVFLHASDGLHGDLGIVKKDDVIIWISKSGNSEEFKSAYPLLDRIGIPIIGITGNMNSHLEKYSNVALDVTITEEACPNNLTPTASTTATLAMGDALAIAVLKKRNFTKEDFAYLHPGGSLGKQLLLKVDDIMQTGDLVPVIKQNASFHDIVLEMNSKRFGSTCVVNDDRSLAGIVTDGDLKRLIQDRQDLDTITAVQVMSKSPKTVTTGTLASKAMHIMKIYDIMQIIVVDEKSRPVGMIHLHHLLEVGIS